MDVELVMDELEQALRTIEGLRVCVVGEHPKPPAAYVSFPETIVYDKEYGRGSDEINLQAVLIIGQTNARNTRRALAAYCDGNGNQSVKTVLEAFDYQTCDVVVVPSVEFDVVTLARIDYMAALFSIQVTGSGV